MFYDSFIVRLETNYLIFLTFFLSCARARVRFHYPDRARALFRMDPILSFGFLTSGGTDRIWWLELCANFNCRLSMYPLAMLAAFGAQPVSLLYIHMRTHKLMHTHTHIHRHTHTHTYAHTHSNARMHMQILTNTSQHPLGLVQICMHACSYVYTYTRTHTHIHTHTYTHTRIHAHAHVMSSAICGVISGIWCYSSQLMHDIVFIHRFKLGSSTASHMAWARRFARTAETAATAQGLG